MEKDLKDLKVKYELPAKDKVHKRQYRVNGLKKAASKEIIPGLKISVAEYFKNKHEVELKYPNMPLGLDLNRRLSIFRWSSAIWTSSQCQGTCRMTP